MKILFTGPLLDFSGFAHASRNLLRALNEDPRLTIAARPLRYDQLDPGQTFETPDWMQPLLKEDLMDIELGLQMTTCNIEAVPVPGIVNGLYTFLETDRIQQSWAQKANEFDFLIVPSRANAQALLNSGVNKPILVAGPPCDADVYEADYQPFEIEQVGDRTIFYNVCQLSTKKGIDLLLRAYFAAFAGMPDQALLVLKTYVNMQDRSNDLEAVKQYINHVKQRCRIPIQDWPPVLPIVYTMTDEEIHGLHRRGDAYVCTSRAEGWGIPVFDALAHGGTVISHDRGGLADFVTKDNSLLLGGTPQFFYDMPHQDPGLFTGMEQCFEVSSSQLALTMQHFHLLRRGAQNGELSEEHQKEWEAVLTRRQNAKQVGQKLDYRRVHERIVDQLLAVQSSWQETGTARFEETLEATV
jgi:hypothetical protein